MSKLSMLVVTALMWPAATWAQQTITLRDGTQWNGRLISAADRIVTFHVDNGDTRTFDYDQVRSISFNGGDRDRDRGYNGAAAYPNAGTDYRNPTAGYQNGSSIRIPAGTNVAVRTNESIDSRDANDSRSYSAQVDRDIADLNGNVLIPRGSDARLVVCPFGNGQLGLDLQSVSVNGQRHFVNTDEVTEASRPGVGENRRTGAYVGGGAVLGTLLGAIAGGGKGAAIGALAGAGAGAGTEVLTRGDHVHVPAETILNFRLENNLRLNPVR